MKKTRLYIVMLVLLSASAYAISSPWSGGAFGAVADVLEEGFRIIADLLTREYVVYGLTLIGYILLFSGIYRATLSKIKIFGSGDGKLNRSGNITMVAMTLLTVISIFFYTGGSPADALKQTLQPFGTFGAVMLGLLFFASTFFGLRDQSTSARWRYSMMSAGLGMILAGYALNRSGWSAAGFLIILLSFAFGGLAGTIDTRFGGGRRLGGSPDGNPDGRGGGNTAQVTGMVVGPNGPIGGATVTFERERRLLRNKTYTRSTDSAGNYTVNLPFGEYDAWASTPAGNSPRRTLHIHQQNYSYTFQVAMGGAQFTLRRGTPVRLPGGRQAVPWYNRAGNLVRVQII